MEAVISAVAGDLVSRIISFLINKCTDRTATNVKTERLQQLLLRIHAIVEEADGRCITNPMMLTQLKVLVASMYRGYHMLDKVRYKSLVESFTHDESITSIPLKRSRTIPGTMRSFAESNELESALENLEGAMASMTEFVILLGGCERICRRPYDTYLYIDSFMFGRHVEKQQIMNTLLNDPRSHGAPAVLPVIGGTRIGKKTLVSHVSKNERIQSHFSSILFIHGDSISRMEQAKFSRERTLVVVEFVTDVDDDDWEKFYSSVTRMTAEGSKLIIISRIRNLARFGTVPAVFLNSLSPEEYRYLFKMLAFGSADGNDYPHLASILNELAVLLGGSLITANAFGDLLRRNLNLKLWLRVLRHFKGLVGNNLSKYGGHPKDLLDAERPIDMTIFCSSITVSLRAMPEVERDYSPRKQTHISLVDLSTGSAAIPNEEFVGVAWESRIPPYTRTIFAGARVVAKHGYTTSTRKRRSSI